MSKKDEKVKGIVVECLPNTQFKVQLEDGTVVRAYLAGKMKLHRIRVLVGDHVELVLDTQGDNNRLVTRTKI